MTLEEMHDAGENGLYVQVKGMLLSISKHCTGVWKYIALEFTMLCQKKGFGYS